MLQELILSIQLADLKEDYRKNYKQHLEKLTESKFEDAEPNIDPVTTELFQRLLKEVQKNHK